MSISMSPNGEIKCKEQERRDTGLPCTFNVWKYKPEYGYCSYCYANRVEDQLREQAREIARIRGELRIPKERYDEYIRSSAWRDKSGAIKWLAGNKCSWCGNPTESLSAHHNTYVRLGYELPSDIMSSCDTCHQIFSSLYEYSDKLGYHVLTGAAKALLGR